MSNNYVSPAVMGARYGYAYMPINHGVFRKSKSEKKGVKRLKKHATNKGKMHTVVVFSCNDTDHGTFGGK